MGIFKRVRDITVATVHEVLDQVEEPISMLNQYMREIEKEISQAEVMLARQVAMEKKWKAQVEETEQRIEKRLRQAEFAIEKGDEAVARQAIADKQVCEGKVMEYRTQYEALISQNNVLRGQMQELKDKYYEMKNKKAALLARANAAKATKQMNRAIYSIDTESAVKGFARMEERIMMMEASADPSRYLREAYTLSDTEIAGSEKVEKELELLKKSKAEVQAAAAK
ncbi:PspA/IM30 family protein [Aneurinibacillus tyrosinisolvens]|uniref:PspA/IM30 family protein n=1 Tax=Aneurinibacillus tyrosinisolvens TaxID=1443435 RepID=UPI00063FB584|nr:PspA/IM30 family protein [Aneurinibacillus tyrosinisolvens]